MPITPRGTVTRSISSPFGRVHRAITLPSGSGSAATASTPAAIASTRPASRYRRSSIAAPSPRASPARTSRTLASRITSRCARITRAIARSACSRSSPPVSASAAAAARAASPIASIVSAIETVVFTSTLMDKQYQIVAVYHDRTAAITEPRFDLLRMAAGNSFGLLARVLGQPSSEFAPRAVD